MWLEGPLLLTVYHLKKLSHYLRTATSSHCLMMGWFTIVVFQWSPPHRGYSTRMPRRQTTSSFSPVPTLSRVSLWSVWLWEAIHRLNSHGYSTLRPYPYSNLTSVSALRLMMSKSANLNVQRMFYKALRRPLCVRYPSMWWILTPCKSHLLVCLQFWSPSIHSQSYIRQYTFVVHNKRLALNIYNRVQIDSSWSDCQTCIGVSCAEADSIEIHSKWLSIDCYLIFWWNILEEP